MYKSILLLFHSIVTNSVLCQKLVDMSLAFTDSPIVYKLTTKSVKEKNITIDYIAFKKIKNNALMVFTNTDSNDYFNNRKFNAYIDNKGNNLSFYLGDNASQLIRILFGMPKNKVGIDSSWSLDVDLTSFRGLLKCDSAFKKDQVKIINFQTIDNDTLVIVKYDFEEYFEGHFMNIKKSSIKYFGEGVFSIKKGKWLNYNCTKQTSLNSLITTQLFKLEATTYFPKIILNQFDH
jgi:hypothetical protein